jgi:hypothetical protein
MEWVEFGLESGGEDEQEGDEQSVQTGRFGQCLTSDHDGPDGTDRFGLTSNRFNGFPGGVSLSDSRTNPGENGQTGPDVCHTLCEKLCELCHALNPPIKLWFMVI